MTRAFPLVALFALFSAGCITSAPFTAVLENGTDETMYVDASFGMVQLNKEVGDEWSNVAESSAMLCASRCGVPGPILCAMVDEAMMVFELAPGETTEVEFDGDGYVITEAGCFVQVGHGGPARLSVCHSAEANLLDQDATGRGLRSGQTLNRDCVDHEVEIEAGAEVVLTLTN
jgi:hypothetical protein